VALTKSDATDLLDAIRARRGHRCDPQGCRACVAGVTCSSTPRYDPEFREGAVRIVRETGKPIAQVARDLGIHEGTLGNWVNKDRVERAEKERFSVDEWARLHQLEREVAELRMERDVLTGNSQVCAATVGQGVGRRVRW
jgi:transposase